jgi:hypothetical protein
VNGWTEVPIEEDMAAQWAAMSYEAPRIFRKGDLTAMVGREPCGGNESDVRWHVSISHPERVPSWQELVEAAHSCRPGICFSIGVPPRSWWMNVHPHVLHLWETRDAGLEADYRLNARGDEPT